MMFYVVTINTGILAEPVECVVRLDADESKYVRKHVGSDVFVALESACDHCSAGSFVLSDIEPTIGCEIEVNRALFDDLITRFHANDDTDEDNAARDDSDAGEYDSEGSDGADVGGDDDDGADAC